MHTYLRKADRTNNRQTGRKTLLTYMHLDYKQAKHTFIQTYAQTDRQAGRQAGRQADIH